MAGLRNSDDISLLKRRLREIPADLEDFYGHMLDSIEPFYKVDAAAIFKLFQASLFHPIKGRMFNIPALSRAHSAAVNEVISMEISPRLETQAEDIRRVRTCLQQENWLKNCCKGLLEASSVKNLGRIFLKDDNRFPPINFMHRTVKEYIEKPVVWVNICKAAAGKIFPPELSLLMADIIILKQAGPLQLSCESGLIRNVGNHALEAASYLDETTAKHQVGLLDELDRVMSQDSSTGELLRGYKHPICRQDEVHWTTLLTLEHLPDHYTFNFPPSWNLDFLSHAVHLDLRFYLDQKLILAPGLLEKRQGIPLFIRAFRKEFWDRKEADEKRPFGPNPGTVEVLLRHGADPNQLFGGFTTWKYIVHYVHSSSKTLLKDPSAASSTKEAMELMLKYGANPTETCFRDGQIWARDSVLRLEEHCLYRPHNCGHLSASELISEMLHPPTKKRGALVSAAQGTKRRKRWRNQGRGR
jgi:hypothetical protein